MLYAQKVIPATGCMTHYKRNFNVGKIIFITILLPRVHNTRER